MSASMSLTARDRRALAIGALVLVGALAFRAAIPAREAMRRLRVDNQALSDRIAIAGRVAAGRASLGDTLAVLEARSLRADSLLLPRGSAPSVASALATVVRSSARSAGLELLAATSEHDSTATAPFQRASIRVEAQGDVSGLMQFLLLVELAPGLLDVRELSVTPTEPTAGNDRAEVLRISLTIEGVALAGRTGTRTEGT